MQSFAPRAAFRLCAIAVALSSLTACVEEAPIDEFGEASLNAPGTTSAMSIPTAETDAASGTDSASSPALAAAAPLEGDAGLAVGTDAVLEGTATADVLPAPGEAPLEGVSIALAPAPVAEAAVDAPSAETAPVEASSGERESDAGLTAVVGEMIAPDSTLTASLAPEAVPEIASSEPLEPKVEESVVVTEVSPFEPIVELEPAGEVTVELAAAPSEEAAREASVDVAPDEEPVAEKTMEIEPEPVVESEIVEVAEVEPEPLVESETVEVAEAEPEPLVESETVEPAAALPLAEPLRVRISWEAADSSDLGYFVYYGDSEDTADTFGRRLSIDDVRDGDLMTATLEAPGDIETPYGDRLCFSISAWNESSETERSPVRCVDTPAS